MQVRWRICSSKLRSVCCWPQTHHESIGRPIPASPAWEPGLLGPALALPGVELQQDCLVQHTMRWER